MSLSMWKALNKALPSLNLDVPNENYHADYLPTRDFPHPSPGGKGTKNLCERCLTLLYQVVLEFGDGSQLYPRRLAHSIFRLDGTRRDYSPNPPDINIRLDGFVKQLYEPQSCVICKNIKILVDNNKKCGTSKADIRITWTLQSVDPQICFRMKFPLSCIQVRIEAKQYDQYAVTLGSFALWKDGGTDINGVVIQDNPVLLPLDNLSTAASTNVDPDSEPKFVSTSGPSTREMIATWLQECAQTHSACTAPLNVHPSMPDVFVPGRLIYITYQTSSDGSDLPHAHIVEKSVPSDFSLLTSGPRVYYLSLSHCWGPAPDPNAPLEGRAKSVLTMANHSAWRSSIPLRDLTATALEAILLCRAIGFEYIWIDSLCIIQDNLDDWRTESATMGDIYRFAWCNIAAIWSCSDADGFINFQRDPTVDFGFHVYLPEILGIEDPVSVRNERGEKCTLLQARAWLTWDFEPPHGGCARETAPLLSRAWVFQERQLARRTLAFTDKTVYWSCETTDHCENKQWSSRSYASPALRKWQRRAMSFKVADGCVLDKALDDQLTHETMVFWGNCVMGYTDCKLTKPKDRLIALSSIAKEITAVGQMRKVKYLAGLWDWNLEDQLLWSRAKPSGLEPGERVFVPPRRKPGDAEYAAPTWSWASIEVPIGTGSMPTGSTRKVALVRDAAVELSTQFEYGTVENGYIRMAGRLSKISSIGYSSPNNPWVLDEKTGGRMHFGFDTSEDLETVKRKMSTVRWLPIRLGFSKNSISCGGILVADADEHRKRKNTFIKPGDKVYKRLGHINFGRTLEHMDKDVLLLREINTTWKGEGATYEQYLDNFKLNDEEWEEFVLI